jgi:undecaprenyl-diphosphatase
VEQLSLFHGVILGVVEGITEFLPISSTGHMILVGEWLGFTGETAETFEVFIQLGAILSVLVLYFKRFFRLIPGNQSSSTGFAGIRGLMLLIVACIPVSLLGLIFRDFIRDYLFSSYTVALALIVGGVAMILLEHVPRTTRVRDLDSLSLGDAVVVGLFQCFALWPGMSRSASTIIGGLLRGLERTVAAEFSFLVAVPVMCAAVGWDLLKSISHLDSSDVPLFAIGFFVSFVVALVAIRSFLHLLKRFTLAGFGYYRIALGCSVLLFSSM